jgi:hypothetical protein
VGSGQERRVDVEEEAVFSSLHRPRPATSRSAPRTKVESIDVASKDCRRGVRETLWERSVFDTEKAEAQLVAPASVDSSTARDLSLPSWARIRVVDIGQRCGLRTQGREFRVAVD